MTTNMTPRETADALTLNIGGTPRPAFTTRVPRGTVHPVSVGRGRDFGIEEVDGLKWIASCDDHGTFVQTRTKAGAMSSTGLDCCDECREEAERPARGDALRDAHLASRETDGHTAYPEQRYYSEAAAHRNRRTCIEAGHAVSLIAYDPEREAYVFDLLD